MKTIIYYILIASTAILFTNCEKDNITNDYITDNPDRIDKNIQTLKEVIASSPNGWTMMVKSNLSKEVYTPIVLKFDTIKNKVDIKTVYGIVPENKEDYFRIAKGTGAPQLIFTTGSVMTSLYRLGAITSDITDHVYNVLSINQDTIEIQPYRSGGIYSKEGGEKYKLFKTSSDWSWARDTTIFNFNIANHRLNMGDYVGEIRIENKLKQTTAKQYWFFEFWDNATLDLLSNRFLPFSLGSNAGAGGFMKDYPFTVMTDLTNFAYTNAIQGHNAISFIPLNIDFDITTKNVKELIPKLNTHYLVVNNRRVVGNNVKMDLEAYDKQGNTIIKAYYDNKL